jgi:carbon monoxide dehydrogenase subunit G
VKITGTATLHAPPSQVWAALNDPAVLARTIPGWEQMEPAGPDSYRLTIAARVASIQGTYTGDVSLTDRQEPTSLQLAVNAAGAPGTLNAHVRVCLEPAADGTKVTYDADAVPDGMIAGVGQRLLASTAKKLADEFFTSVDGTLVSQAAPVPGPVSPQEAPSAGPPQGVRAGGAAGVASPTSAPARGASGVTRERPTEDRQPAGRTGARPPTASFLTGVLAGAAATLAGVSVARLLGRRSSRHR